MPEWYEQFLGRGADLDKLKQAWAKAQSGDPQLYVLLAESGIGKTRLVQEFYHWLSTNHDPDGYWPDSFERVGQQMEVNPTFRPSSSKHHRSPEIPWLWWGIRCERPPQDDRRSESYSAQNLFRSFGILQPHISPLLIKRERNAHKKKALLSIGSVILALSPLKALLLPLHASELLIHIAELGKEGVHIGKEALETFISTREAKELDHRSSKAITGRIYEERKGQATIALDALSAYLEDASKEAKTIPVVLVLDDAHWADPETLVFVEQLLARASDKKWPLLLIATHWQLEWLKDQKAAMSEITETTNLAQVVKRQEKRYPNFSANDLENIKDLTPMLNSAFPGLLGEQSDYILYHSGGNPLILAEFILLLEREHHHFENGNVKNALKPSGMKRVEEVTFTREGLAYDRFYSSSLEDEYRHLLGWSSYEGTEFLHEITHALAVSKETGPVYEKRVVSSLLEHADEPLILIQNHAEFAMASFRQVALHDVAKKYLKDTVSIEAVQSVICTVCTEWIESGRIDKMPDKERTRALQTSIRELPEGNTRTLALIKLSQEYLKAYEWQFALELAREAVDGFDANNPVPPTLPLTDLDSLRRSLFVMHDYVRALKASNMMLESARHILKEFGESPQSLRDVSVSLDRVADVELALGNREEALKRYTESLGFCKRIRDEFGESPESLRDVSVSLAKLALLHMEGDSTIAGGYAKDAREGFARIVQLYGRYPEAVQDLERIEGLVAALGG